MKPRLLIIGCGNVLSRALPWLQKRFRVYILKHHTLFSSKIGFTGVKGDLDKISTLVRLRGLAHYIIYSAPPESSSYEDKRVGQFIRALSIPPSKKRGSILTQSLKHIIYISTSGVYGDCKGAWIDETQRLKPENRQSQCRVDAEKKWRRFAQSQRTGLTILRVPAIYAYDRLPLAFLKANTPVINVEEDSFSNRIHADDLAHIINIALFRAPTLRVYHASDSCPLKMGQYFTLVAQSLGLPIPPQLSKEEVKEIVSPGLWHFMRESRCLDNTRIKKELRIQLKYPSIKEFLKTL